MYPPVPFCLIWAFELFLIWVVRDFFYPMLPETLGIFLLGALAFSLGSWIAIYFPGSERLSKRLPSPSSDRIISYLVYMVILGCPFFCRWIFGIVAENGGGGSFLLTVVTSVNEQLGHSRMLTVFGTLNMVALAVALIAFYERERHPKRAFVAVTASLGMGMLMGQKDGGLSLVAGLVCLDWIRVRRLNWKLLVAMFLVFAAVVATIELYVHIGTDSREGQLMPVIRNFALYASGGLVAFDRVVRQPNVVPGINPVYVTYLRIIRRLGSHVEVPDRGEFVSIGPDIVDNVFTIYWSYLFLGYSGSLVCVGLLAFLTTVVYKKAIHGGQICAILFATLFRGVAFSGFNDSFFQVYFLLVVFFTAWLVYGLPGLWAKPTRPVLQSGLVVSQ